MQSNTHVSIQLLNVKEPPFRVHGIFKGTERISEDSNSYIILEGTVGDKIGKTILIPENLVHEIEVTKKLE